MTMLRPALTGRPRKSRVRRRQLPALWFLWLYLALMLLVPSELILQQIGSAGTPANILGLGLLLWWLCSRLSGLNRVPLNPVHVVLGLLSVCVLLSLANGFLQGWIRPVGIKEKTDVVWTLLPITAQEIYSKSVLGASRGLITVGSWVGVALMTIDGLRSRRELDRLVTVLVWLASVVATIGIIQYFTGNNLARFIALPGLSANYEFGVSISRSDLNRVSATTTHPIEFCVLLTAVLPLALHRALHPEQATARRRFLSSILPAGLIALGVPMAVSRSGILALTIIIVVLFIGWPANRRIWMLVLLPPVLVVMRAALPGLLGTIRSLFAEVGGDPSISGRTDDYGPLFGIYSDHPILGRGSFTFMPGYYRTVDNQLLINLIELGAVGLVATLAMFGTAFYVARYCKRHADSVEQSHLGLCLSASLLALTVSYFTFDAWGFAKTGAITFVLIGITGALRRFLSTTPSSEVSP